MVDVFRRASRPARDFGEYILYITFFPQLIAGPIGIVTDHMFGEA